MLIRLRGALALVMLLSALEACGKPATDTDGGPGGGGPITPAVALHGNPCEWGLVSKADAEAILGEAVTSQKTIAGLANTCEFETATFAKLTVTLTSTIGRESVDLATSPQMPGRYVPLSGVGDAAAWQIAVHQLIASKGGKLCRIGASGPPSATAGATSDKLGALCNRMFAAG
jgi:hypothetical protein